MDLQKHAGFLANVRDYISKNPEVAPYVTEFISHGIQDALKLSREMASDMESALIGILAIKGKEGKKLTLEKIQKWYGKGSMNAKVWDKPIKQLQS